MYLLLFLITLPFLLSIIYINSFVASFTESKIPPIELIDSIKASYFSCSNAYSLRNKTFTPKNTLDFSNLKGCKDSLLSIGYANDLDNFLNSYCEYFFKDKNVLIEIDGLEPFYGNIELANNVYTESIKNTKIIEKHLKYCGKKFNISEAIEIGPYLIPTIFINKKGYVEKEKPKMYIIKFYVSFD